MLFFFFFKQKTAYEIYQCDWSSDVCSSDLKAFKFFEGCLGVARLGVGVDIRSARGFHQMVEVSPPVGAHEGVFPNEASRFKR